MTTHTAYRHAQPYVMLWLVLAISCGAGAAIVWTAGGARALTGLATILLTLALGLLLLGRLVISVDNEALRWSFGFVGWPAWQTPLKDILSTEVARADVHFGSGIKGSMKHRQYNVVTSGPALRLYLMDGRQVTLGTPEPQRLQGFIEARLDRSVR